MKLFDIYRWALPSRSSLQQGMGDQMTQQLNTFYKSVQNDSLFFLFTAVAFALIFFIIYYWPYNNRPGRHYRWQKWLIFLGISFACTFAVTLIIGASIHAPRPIIWVKVMFMLSLINSLYSALLYSVFSFILSQFPARWTKTNANLFMKIGRR